MFSLKKNSMAVSSLFLVLAFVLKTEAFVTNKKLYYGEKFESEIPQVNPNLPQQKDQLFKTQQMNNEELLNYLHEVIKSAHIKRDNQADNIVPNCDQLESAQKGRCFQHQALGYDPARKLMFGTVDLKQNSSGEYFVKDVYCDYEITNKNFGGEPTIGPGLYPTSGNIVNTEHTWPQSRFTGKFNKETQKSDLHHLFPTDSEMNSTRSSFRFGVVDKEKKVLKCGGSKFGTSDVDHQLVFEPPQHHKGNVARAIFYFVTRYKMNLSPAEEFTLREWHKEDPVDEEEMRRNDAIENLQGNRNPFIDFPELVDRVQFFAFKNSK